MPAHISWARWSKASVSDHFATKLSPLFIEGQHRDTDEDTNFFELRMDGPRLLEVSKDYWKLRIEINVLCQSVMNETDYHVIDDMVGLAQSAFVNAIHVYRYGNRVGDDNSFVGCYILQQDRRKIDYTETHVLGQIDIRTKLLQSMVEAHYVMDLQV